MLSNTMIHAGADLVGGGGGDPRSPDPFSNLRSARFI